jgi:hypothetical protein
MRIVFTSAASWAREETKNVIIVHVVMAETTAPDKARIPPDLAKGDLKEQPWYVRREGFGIREISSNT